MGDALACVGFGLGQHAAQKMGLKGSLTTEVYLNDVPLPADRLIGRAGEGLAEESTPP